MGQGGGRTWRGIEGQLVITSTALASSSLALE